MEQIVRYLWPLQLKLIGPSGSVVAANHRRGQLTLETRKTDAAEVAAPRQPQLLQEEKKTIKVDNFLQSEGFNRCMFMTHSFVLRIAY